VILLLNKPVIAQDLRKWTAALLISSLFFSAHAQQPYALNTKKDALILSSAVALGGVAYMYKRALQPPTLTDIKVLNASTINSLDRKAMFNYNQSAARNSDIILYTVASITTASIISTALNTETKKHNLWNNAVMALEANLLNVGITELTKNTVQRIRPYAYNYQVPLSEKVTLDTKRSFFSGHTSVVATNSFLTAHLVSNYIEIEKKWLIWVPAALIPAYTGFERVRAGKHFVSDVVVGYAIGMSCGLVIPQIHKSKENFTLNASHYSDTTLIGFSYRF
jgi:membrane-associated phospholipid phosphatase